MICLNLLYFITFRYNPRHVRGGFYFSELHSSVIINVSLQLIEDIIYIARACVHV